MTQSQILNANFDWLQAGKKEFFPEYKINNQKTMFDRIAKAKRSTFGRSKFTVVGSPTITDNGIASGFSAGNFPRVTNTYIKDANKLKITLTLIVTKDNPNGVIFGSQGEFRCIWQQNWLNVFANKNTMNEASVWAELKPDGFNIGDKITLDILLEKNITNRLIVYKNGIEYKKVSIVNRTVDIGNNTINLGADGWMSGGYQSTMSIDLKQVSIEADDIEVFNGNKTGVDQIKKDDYTIVPSSGSTVIVDEKGIASGFSSGNYITSENKFYVDISKDFEVHLKINNMLYTQGLGDTGVFRFIGTGTDRFSFRFNGQACYLVSGGEGNSSVNTGIRVFEYDRTCDLDLIFGLKGTSFYVKYRRSYDSSWINLTTTTINLSDKFGSSYVELGRGFTPMSNDRGQLDLNAFKIYVDNQLVYQPTLRIPYTLSKTNEKIVDAVYRDRVQDMYEQYGYTHYYTLGDDDYTLQTVPNEKIVDSYYADNSFMELTADLALTQGGGAVSGQTVNLKRPYKDNKYINTLTVTSKDTNSFVAGASGQWITKGKGVLG